MVPLLDTSENALALRLHSFLDMSIIETNELIAAIKASGLPLLNRIIANQAVHQLHRAAKCRQAGDFGVARYWLSEARHYLAAAGEGL